MDLFSHIYVSFFSNVYVSFASLTVSHTEVWRMHDNSWVCSLDESCHTYESIIWHDIRICRASRTLNLHISKTHVGTYVYRYMFHVRIEIQGGAHLKSIYCHITYESITSTGAFMPGTPQVPSAQRSHSIVCPYINTSLHAFICTCLWICVCVYTHIQMETYTKGTECNARHDCYPFCIHISKYLYIDVFIRLWMYKHVYTHTQKIKLHQGHCKCSVRHDHLLPCIHA